MGYQLDEELTSTIQQCTYAIANQRILEMVLEILSGKNYDAFDAFNIEELLAECNEEAIQTVYGDPINRFGDEDEEDDWEEDEDDDEW